jgi:SSS family solute:Na+ symporter
MSSQGLALIDYIIIILSVVFSIGFGISFARRQKSTSNYFAASGSIPSWAVGISILATLVSSITFLAYPGEGFSSNWILLVQAIMVVVVLSFLVWVVVPLYRKVIGISAYEYFEKRFGFIARLYGSLAFSLTHFSKMGTVFFLLALALAGMTGWNTYSIIWVLGAGIIILTMLGGIEAVIWLDVIQGFMLIGGGILCAIVLLIIPEGGPMAVINTAFEFDKIGFAPYDFDFVQLTFIVMVLNGIFYGIQKYGTDQTIVQRYLTARSDRGAERAAMMGVLLSLPVWTLFMFIGTLLFVYYQVQGNFLPPDIRPDAIFPYFIMHELPPGVTGLVLAALIAAAISSLDSDLNCLSAVAVDDYYKRFRPKSTDKQQLWVGKMIVVISGIAALIIASVYVSLGDQGVLGVVFGLYAIFSGGIAGLFLLGLLSKRANKEGLYVGLIACILFTAWAVLTSTKVSLGGEKRILLDLGSLNFTQHKYMLGVYSHVVVFVVGYLASFLFPKKEVSDDLTIYGWLAIRKERREKVRS